MRSEIKNRLKNLLKYQMGQLEGVLNSDERVLPVSMDEPGDVVDEINGQIMNRMYLSLHERKFRSLERIRGTLKRIESGTFGECLGCGDAIEDRRLEVLPTSTLCVVCQDMHEIQGQSYAQAAG